MTVVEAIYINLYPSHHHHHLYPYHCHDNGDGDDDGNGCFGGYLYH